MAIALFGATGRTGALVLPQAARRGWPLRALVRDEARARARLGSAGDSALRLVGGDARDAAAVEATLVGPGGPVGAVLCALGMADITQPATDFSDSLAALVAAMQRCGVRRIVAIASAGVLDHPQGGLRSERPGFPPEFAHVGAEHRRNLATLSASRLDWTLLCPPILVDEERSAGAPVRLAWALDDLPAGGTEARRTDLARAMCDLLTERSTLRRRVGVVSLPFPEAA